MHTTVAWPSSAQQIGLLWSSCLFNYHHLAPIFYMAMPSKLHFILCLLFCALNFNLLFPHFCPDLARLPHYVGKVCDLDAYSPPGSVCLQWKTACHTLHLECSYHLHSSRCFLLTWDVVMFEKATKRRSKCVYLLEDMQFNLSLTFLRCNFFFIWAHYL